MATKLLSKEQRDILDETPSLVGITGRARDGTIWQCAADTRGVGEAEWDYMRLAWVPEPGNGRGRLVTVMTTTRYGRYISSDTDRDYDIVEILGETPARRVAAQMCEAHKRGLLDLTQWPDAVEFIKTFGPDIVVPPFKAPQ